MARLGSRPSLLSAYSKTCYALSIHESLSTQSRRRTPRKVGKASLLIQVKRRYIKPQHNSTLHILSPLTPSLRVRLLQLIVPLLPSLASVASSLSWWVVPRWMPTLPPAIGRSLILVLVSLIKSVKNLTDSCRSTACLCQHRN